MKFRMILPVFTLAVLLTPAFSRVSAQENEKKPAYQFTDDLRYPATPVENQYRSSTCWSFSSISFLESELLRQGLRLNTDTMARQGRYDPEFGEPARWGRLVKAVHGSSAVVAYGAFHEGRLAAYAITCRDGGWLHLMHQNSRTDDLRHFPNHALSFAVTRLAAEDAALEGISFGIRSLIDSVGLHDFKLKLGYEFIERTSAFQLHPAVAPVLLSGALRRIVGGLRRVRPQDQRIEKVEAVLEGAARSARSGSGSAMRRITA